MIGSLFDRLVSTHGFMPHGMCYLWQPDVLWLHVASDGLIALAYFSIPLTLLYLVRNRRDLLFNWMFLCFGVFIIACGVTHVMEIWTIWQPMYWLSGAIKALTALASIVTSILLIRLTPDLLRVPSVSALREANLALELEVGVRVQVEDSLRRANETLELRVAERTAELEALNKTLRIDNERFALASEAAGLGFWSIDIAADTVQWDERMFQLYGRSPLDGDQPAELWANSVHPADRDRCVQESAEARNGTRAFDTEYRIVQPDGAIRHLRAAARVSRDAAGHAVRMSGVNFDITDLKRAHEQFHLAIEAAPTGMLLMHATGRIVLVNAQIEKLFGYPRAELLDQPIEMLVPVRFRGQHPDFRKEFFGAPQTRAMGGGRELFGLRKDGAELPVEIGLNPLQTPEGDFVLSSIVDLTQRREVERMRTEFISTVSHELRTPLTSISGSLGLLQAGAMGPLSDKAAAMVRIAYNNSGRLVRIINDILDIGKLESGQMALQLHSTPLLELLQQSIEANSGYADKFQVRFLLEGGSAEDYVMADSERLMQVLTNLLSNAAKFSPPGADVWIRLRPGPTLVRIEVEDSGPGIPDAFQGRVFERFAQADASSDRRFEGTGLGLSITRKLLEAMGGTIRFTTVVGHGTTFYFELPRSDAASAVPRKMPLSETAAQHMLLFAPGTTMSGGNPYVPRILYVEDDDDLISVIGATLAHRAQVVPAYSLLEAERLLREEAFDLVILDQSLPDGNGLNWVDRLPGLLGRSIPVVLLATNTPEHVNRNVSAVLVKSQASAAQAAATILAYLPTARP
jgi:PAS domain S-box-containing protein